LPYKNQPTHEAGIPIRMAILKVALTRVTRPGLNHFYMHAAAERNTPEGKIPEGRHHRLVQPRNEILLTRETHPIGKLYRHPKSPIEVAEVGISLGYFLTISQRKLGT
jgi:hypothetical protein